jgi:N-acetylmuramic acid 6-phosphate etherase
MTPAELRVVGIDGGATRTRYLLADGGGRALRRVEGPGSLLGAGRDQEVTERMVRTVESLVEAEADELPVAALCAGLAGAAGRADVAARLRERLLETGVARRARVVPDAEVAFADAFAEEDGILLVAGTGSIGLARLDGSPLRRVGGWGALLGDEGSGYGLGLEGLRAGVRGLEGRGTYTELGESLLQTLELPSIEALLAWSGRVGKDEIAALAPRVVEAADRGDEVASGIVERSVDGLVAHARALRRLGAGDDADLGAGRTGTRPPAPLRVALVGGLVHPEGPLRRRVEGALSAEGFQVIERRIRPAQGAVALALGMVRDER